MRAVLEYGETHQVCDGVAPPSPNSSSGDVTQREAILNANRAYQKDILVRPGPPVAAPPTSDVSADNSVAGSIASSAASSGAPAGGAAAAVLPADNPGPNSIGGGFSPLDGLLELGDVEFDQAMLNWFKLSGAPTEFKLIAGENGREFLFCVPNVEDVDVEPVERLGRRTVGMQVKPKQENVDLQAEHEEIVAALAAANPVDAVEEESSSASGNDTTVSSATAALEREEFQASLELTK